MEAAWAPQGFLKESHLTFFEPWYEQEINLYEVAEI